MDRGLVANRRVAKVTGLLAFTSVCCVGLAAFRAAYAHNPGLDFLVFNLVLAWLPLLFALVVHAGALRGLSPGALAVPGLLWLVFLPNAPYIVTDFVHLRWTVGMPLWFDVLMIATFAATGALLGFLSLFLVQSVVRAIAGPLVARCFAVGALGMCSVGMYLGRFVRINSWDALQDPLLVPRIARMRIEDPTGNPALLPLLLVFSAVLMVGYWMALRVALPRIARWR